MFLQSALAAFIACLAQPAFALDCVPVSSLKELFLAEIPVVQGTGEHQAGVVVTRSEEADAAMQAAYEYGVTERMQLAVEWETSRVGGESANGMAASIGILLLCTRGQPLLRLDAGIERDRDENETGGSALVALGQAAGFGGWVVNASRSGLDKETAYAAAIMLDTELPISIEASHERGEASRSNWVAAGIYLFSTERFELGIAFADGSADASGMWEVLLSVAGEF